MLALRKRVADGQGWEFAPGRLDLTITLGLRHLILTVLVESEEAWPHSVPFPDGVSGAPLQPPPAGLSHS